MSNSKHSPPHKRTRKFSLNSGALFILFAGLFCLFIGIFAQINVLLIIAAIILSWPLIIITSILVIRLAIPAPQSDLGFTIVTSQIPEGSSCHFHIHRENIQMSKLPFFIPGIRTRLYLHFTSKNKRSFSLYLPVHLIRGYSSQKLERGEYQLTHYGYHFSDALNIASLEVYAQNILPSSITVFPLAMNVPQEKLSFAGGDIHQGGGLTHFGNDLSDQRKYHPGDDPRRINWKLYGHTEELFLRTKEKEPPPQGNLFIYVDSVIDQTIYKDPLTAMDQLARAAMHIIQRALSNGFNVFLYTPDSTVKPVKEDTVASLLAMLQPSYDKKPSFLLQRDHTPILLLTMPSQKGINSHLIPLFGNTLSPLSVYVVCEELHLPWKRISLKDVFLKPSFIHGIDEKKAQQLSRTCRKTLDDCLQQGARSAQLIP